MMNKDIYPEGYEGLNITDPLSELTRLSQRVTDTAIQITKHRQKKYQGGVHNQMSLIPFDRGILADMLTQTNNYRREMDDPLHLQNLSTTNKDKTYLFAHSPKNLERISKFYPLVESLYPLNQTLVEARQGVGAANGKNKVWLWGGSFSLNPLSVIETFDFLQERSDRLGVSLSFSTYNGGGARYRQTGFFFSGYNAPEYRDTYGRNIDKITFLGNTIAPLGTNFSKGRKQKPILPQNESSTWMFGEKESSIERFDFLGETATVEGNTFAGKGFGILSGDGNFYLTGGFADKYKQGLKSISRYSILEGTIAPVSLELSLPNNEPMTTSFADKGYLMGGWGNGRMLKSITRFDYFSQSLFSVGVDLEENSIGGVGATNV